MSAASNEKRPLKILISAGEASGEMYGAELLDSLRRLALSHGFPSLETFGLGGERMRGAGCETIVDAADVAVVGLAEVLSHLPKLYREFHKLVAEAERRRPDVAILIDFPDWNFRLAKHLHRLGIPVVYYVSPQLWAWRRGRIKLVQKYVDKMMVIFPFERDFYQEHGVKAAFVGHPLSEIKLPGFSREQVAHECDLNPRKQWIALLPGSRRKELLMNLPGVIGAAEKLGADYDYLMPVASTLDHNWVEAQIRVVRGERSNHIRIVLVPDARLALMHSRAAIVASGTATVEAAVVGTPFVIIYRVSPLTWMIGRHLVKLTHYGMVNLIAGREIVPELIQDRFTPEAVAAAVQEIAANGPQRETMLRELSDVKKQLGAGLTGSAADRAAMEVLELLIGESGSSKGAQAPLR